jgi:iron(III) transport system ATP-binding protein
MSFKALEVVDLSVVYADQKKVVDTVSFDLEEGQHLTLLGPSGCGKSTTLRAIAGLERPSAGTIRLFGEPVFDASKRVNAPTEKRNLSMVFQNYAIWPHMTVFENVSYGLRVRNVSAADIKSRVTQALELVGLASFADRMAPALSGGQQQRVALARSFVFNPRLILFDEPLSNLDAKLRLEMRHELKALQTRLGITSVFVTHDQEEALAMSDKVVVLRAGVIEQVGTPLEVYYRPRTRFVADFVGGSNILPVSRAESIGSGRARLHLGDNGQHLDCDWQGAPGAWDGAAVKTVHVALGSTPFEGPNTFQVDIMERSFVGDLVVYGARWGSHQLVVRKTSGELHEPGSTAHARIDPRYVIPLSAEPSA